MCGNLLNQSCATSVGPLTLPEVFGKSDLYNLNCCVNVLVFGLQSSRLIIFNVPPFIYYIR